MSYDKLDKYTSEAGVYHHGDKIDIRATAKVEYSKLWYLVVRCWCQSYVQSFIHIFYAWS